MRKQTFVLLGALLLATAVLAAVYLSTRPATEAGTLVIDYAGVSYPFSWDAVSGVTVEGVLVNGRGEEIPVSGDGVSMCDLLSQTGITDYQKVLVVADDAYSAEVTAEEIAAPGQVYLMRQEDGIRLVVFGDSNSKRNVTNVVRLEVK